MQQNSSNPVDKAALDMAKTDAARGSAVNIWMSVLKISALILFGFAAAGSMVSTEILPQYFLSRQDLPVVIVGVALMLLFAWHRFDDEGAAKSLPLISGRQACLGAGVLAASTFAGHYIILSGYAFSRDEQMALFDAQIYEKGQLAAALPAYWKDIHDALNNAFIPVSVRGEGWISSYRPVNGFLHMLSGYLGNPMITNPILTAIGLLATWRVSAQIWPGQRETQIVAAVFYCLSAQVLVTGMTSYAMPGHLAFNMVWLMLFLHNRWYSHLGALFIGILAIGMHQIVYHPLFAGPVLFTLLLKRRWGLAFIYASVYAVAILAWAMWMKLPVAELGVVGIKSDADDFILTRIGWALANFSPEYLWIKFANLARFFAWQHLLLLPLLLVGGRAMWKSRNPVQMALIGCVVTVLVFKLILRPYQGHGWGYRYLHGLIGVMCLMAAVGWTDLRRRGLASPRQFAIASLVTAGVAMPWLMYKAHVFSGNYADLYAKAMSAKTDLVILEDRSDPFGKDVVYNPPWLDKKPILLMASELDADDMKKLCARYSISFAGPEDYRFIAGEFSNAPESRYGDVARLKRALPKGCRAQDL